MARRSKSRKGRGKDPHFEREAQKYDNPIPSREFIIECIEDQGTPVSFRELSAALEIQEEQVEALSFRVKAMIRDGQLIRNRRGGYCVVNHEDMITGRVIGHPDGFGFLKPEEGGDDLFLVPREMRKVWHGDRVVAQVSGLDQRGRREGAIVEVLERGFSNLVGRLHIEQGVAFVVPDNKRVAHQILISADGLADAQDQQMVVVNIDEHPGEWRQPIGHISEVLGDHMAPGMETDVAIRAHDIPVDWPQAVLDEIAGLTEEVPEAAKEGRVDLRDTPLVTIDGEDARDFDDAVYCEPTRKGWRLLVAIADVSAYVIPGTALDEEAYKRGTSVYFPDRVVPMLPEVLSNGLCSINPKVDRLCMVGELYFDAKGKLFRSRFFEGLMNSHARLTYDKVWAMLQGDKPLREEYAAVLPHLENLHKLFKLLHKARAHRGAIDFDSVETKFRFDDKGKVAEVVPLVRHDAHRMIEECMLAANVAAARHLLRQKMPALYRNHERPSAEKLDDLQAFLHELGLNMEGMPHPTAKDYANLLERAAGRPDYHLIQTVLLRSMMQAIYAADNQGHFGLALPSYAHFTSPIRRYPDLMVHRAIRHLLTGGTPGTFPYSHAHLATFGEHCSTVERRADDASRDSSDALKCEFMLDKVGLEFPGRIVSVNNFGLFVELDEIYVTGLIHITALDRDYFHFDPIGHRLTGERSGKVYRLGDEMAVKVAAVNMDDRKIDFVLPGADAESSNNRGRGPRRRSRGGTRRGGESRDDKPKGERNKSSGKGPEKSDDAKGKSKDKGKPKRKRKSKAKTGKSGSEDADKPRKKKSSKGSRSRRKKRS